MPVSFHLGLFLLIATSTSEAQTTDTTALFRQAGKAASEYEWAVRRHAPFRISAAATRDCDEHVGRFCLTFDSGHDTLPAEPAALRADRERAISVLRAAAGIAPGRMVFTYPLVRYLVEAGRPAEAVPFARAYAGAGAIPADGHMLLGFALHHAGQTEAALAELEAWLALLPDRDQKKIRSLQWLVDPHALERWNRLDLPSRDALAARAWRFADPLLVTPGNELWADHLARFAATRMLRAVPTLSSSGWDTDVEELTIRFGEPVLTTRSWRTGSIGSDQGLTEHWEPNQRTYFPPDPEAALELDVRLDTIWPIHKVVSRTGHSPPTIRKMRVLEHQAFVGDLVRVIGVVPTDSMVKKPLRTTVFLLDSALNIVARADAESCPSCPPADSAMLTASLPLHPAARYYSAELYDPVSRFAARARYRLDRPLGALSNILLTQPSKPTEALSRPVVASGDRFGIYATIDNRDGERRSVAVELEVRSLERGSLARRAAGWVGEKLGVSSPRSPAKLGWSIELDPGTIVPVPVALDIGVLDPGNYRITLTVKHGNGNVDVVKRDFAVISSRSSSSPRP